MLIKSIPRFTILSFIFKNQTASKMLSVFFMEKRNSGSGEINVP